MDREELVKQAKLALARQDLFFYCHLKSPDFYKQERAYLVDLCKELQAFIASEDDILVINAPPRHGKSRTAQNFVEWSLGRNPKLKIMTGSYNETVATQFSKGVRNTIQEQKAEDARLVYTDIFPGIQIKAGDGAANIWSLSEGHVNYLATSPTGTATGFGADIMLIDDVIKNAEEANNATVLDKHWEWFCFTGETEVLTSIGNKAIKDIKIGDKVMTYNHSQCIIEEKEVVRADSHLSSIYRLEFENGETIECTENHQFYTTKGYLSIRQILSAMRCTIEEGETILFPRVSEQSEDWDWGNDYLPKLRKENSFGEEEPTEQILFYGLQERLQSKKCGKSLCKMGKIKRFLEKGISKMSEMWNGSKLASTSYRPRQQEQRYIKPSSSMLIVPYRLSQVSRLSSNDIRRVYDIEVKDNHNFFANGMLVHNCNTMLSRLETGGKIIVIMTRWNSKDLAGRIMDEMPRTGYSVKQITMKALQDDGTMLCEGVLSLKEYLRKSKNMGADIASANFQQEPIDLKGKLYTHFKTYSRLPRDEHGNLLFRRIFAYGDTADEGSDNYACFIAGETFDGEGYILDVIYTQEAMELTEPLTAKVFAENGVNIAIIESNNGGRGFARNVKREIKEKYPGCKTAVKWFHQSKNKIARILSNSTYVMEHIYFPDNWRDRWPDVYDALNRYQRQGKNKHDDAPDALTGIAENIGKPENFSFE